jgi:hypothetical protein
MARTNIGSNPTTAANVDFGAIANQGFDRLAQNQELDRQEAEREATKNQELSEKYGINEDLYMLERTEFRDINDVGTEAVSLLRDRRFEVFSQLQKDPSLENKKKLGKIDSSVKKLSASNTKIKELGEQFVTMLESDEVSGVDEERIQAMLESVERGDIKVHLDDDDNMSYLFYDKNKKLQQVSAFGELMKESPFKRVDLDTEIDAIIKAVGTDKIDTITGGFTTRSNVFGEDQARFVNEEIDAFIGTDAKSLETNPVLADLLNQATNGSSKKKENFTEKEREDVKKWLLQKVKGSYDEVVELRQLSTSAPRAQTAAERNAPSLTKLNPATTTDGKMLIENGKAVLTYAGGLELKESGSNLAIDDIRISPTGDLELRGTDKIKKKGKQGETLEEIAAKEGVNVNFLEVLMQKDNTYTYNVVTDINPIVGQAAISKLGNLLKVSNSAGLSNTVKEKLYEIFPKEEVDKFFANAQADEPVQPTAPKKIKTESGNTYE